MLHVQCWKCQAMAFTENHADPDSAVECACCPQDHHHGNAASADLSKKPCRPLTITVVPGSVHLRASSGGN
jgi:hypothetical protein